jgi:ATP-binding cassette subfamily C protein
MNDFTLYDLGLAGVMRYIAKNHDSRIEVDEKKIPVNLSRYDKNDPAHEVQIKNYFLSLGLVIHEVKFSRPEDLLNEHMPLIILTSAMQWMVCVGCQEGGLQLVSRNNEFGVIECESDHLNELSVFLIQPLSGMSESIRISEILKTGLRNNKIFYSKYFFTSLFMALFALTIPVFSNLYYDKLVPSSSAASLFGVTAIVLVFVIFEFLLRSSKDIYQSIVSRQEDVNVDVSFVESLIYNTTKTSSMSSVFIVWTEFQKIKPVLLNSVFQRMSDIPVFIIFSIIIYVNLGMLVMIPVTLMALSLVLAWVNYKYTEILMDKMKESQSNRNVFITELLYSLRTIHTLNNKNLMLDWVNSSNNQSWLSLKIRKASVYYQSALGAMSNLNQILLMVFAFFLVIKGEITTGAIISSVIVSGRMSGIISGLASTLSTIFTTNKSISDLMKMFVSEQQEQKLLQSVVNLQGDIALRAVNYQYDPQLPKALDNITLDIPKGQRVAIVGECGSGKSSLVSLLSGYCPPTEGSIMYDGYNSRHLAQNFFSRFISMVTNQDTLFTGSIESNFSLKECNNRKRVIEALQVTNCGFVLQHPMGLRYPVSFMARNLSSGQNQQLLLARSLSSEAEIYLWDEPTSSMDEVTEQRIFDHLDHFIQDKTLIMVTHRRYLLKYFDRVLVMKGGKIIRDCAPDKLPGMAKPEQPGKAVRVKVGGAAAVS